jgi:hypothetical protein
MAGGIARTVAVALATSLAVQVAGAATVVDPASARRAVTHPAAAAVDAELASLAGSGRTSELAARLEVVAADRAMAAVAREWLVDRGLHRLAALDSSPPARAALRRLAGLAPTVFARIDPDHGDRPTPLYDAGATARFVLRAWDRRDARIAASRALAAGSTAPVARFASRPGEDASDPVRAGIAEAFRASDVRQLLVQRAAVVDALGRGNRVDGLALVLAERLADAELYRLVVGHADEAAALAALPSAARRLDPRSAFDVLATASRRADIASAAVLALGKLAASEPAARAYLLDAVTAPDIGPSAAAALAALADPTIPAALGGRLDSADSEAARRLLVLALRLDASPAARVELERFAARKLGSRESQRELRQWLAR